MLIGLEKSTIIVPHNDFAEALRLDLASNPARPALGSWARKKLVHPAPMGCSKLE